MRTYACMALFSLASCAQGIVGQQASGPRGSILFVHGAFQDAAVWDELRQKMESLGYAADAVALPRQASVDGPTLASYAQQIVSHGRQMKPPLWLVVHSFGGMSGTVAAATPDDPFEGLVYIAAYAPKPGESMQGLAATDTTNKFSQRNFLVSEDYRYATVLMDDREMLFCNDCPPELAANVAAAMHREPLRPVGEKAEFDPAGLTDDRLAYVVTTKDNAVGTQLQRQMASRAGIQATAEIATGHTPFVSRTEELAALLETLFARASPPTK